MYSKTILLGNLAKDPESRQAGDSNVSRLVVAINDPFSKEKVSYVEVEAWGKLGEICQKYLVKGRQVLVEGRLFQDIWEKDGKKNSKLFVKADNIQFIGGKSDKQQESPKTPTQDSSGQNQDFDDLGKQEEYIPF